MKLSLAWIFDHIDADYKQVDMSALMTLFNEKVAEIEGFYTSKIDLASLYMAQVISNEADQVELNMPEQKKTVLLPTRTGLVLEHWYLVKEHKGSYVWATELDFAGEKESLLPAFYSDEQDAQGSWRQAVPEEDYILELDNKSITHRSDMWGSRGVAREIASLLGLTLKPLNSLITSLDVHEHRYEVSATAEQPFSARNDEPTVINRFAYAYFSELRNGPSLIGPAARLTRIGLRAIDLIVDLTNYVMCDLSQPMHAFDANAIPTKHVELRFAHAGEKLKLLDGETVELHEKDLVITDGTKPISLAGVMGGSETQMLTSTGSVLLESANFNETLVRETAARHKKRTEASARFEKTLDPDQNIIAIERFVRLLQDADISYTVSNIEAIGRERTKDYDIEIDHDFIEKRLGTSISREQVIGILTSLEFRVRESQVGQTTRYHVTVPSFRCTKDVLKKVDILEEIARCFGYTNIPYVLPQKATKPSNVHAVNVLRNIKHFLAYGKDFREVSNYSFYDEDFLRELSWQAQDAPFVQSPVSENWKYLVGSLIPGLLKNITQNAAEHERLSFFEWGRVWQKDDQAIIERKQLAMICYHNKEAISFYNVQATVMQLADMLRLPITWRKVDAPAEAWFAPYQTADIMYGEICIGRLGVLDAAFTRRIMSGHAIGCVLDGDFLSDFCSAPIAFVPTAKYPHVERDISMLVPLAVTVEQIQEHIKASSEYITEVCLVDMFRKDDWQDAKSLTFSYTMQNMHKTLTTQEVDAISAHVSQVVQTLGAQIR